MKNITIYHNPRCSKSRDALSLLQTKKGDITIVEYLKTPLTAIQIKTLLKQLKLNAFDIIRTKESCFNELGLSKNSSDNKLIQAIVDHPILIERPIVTNGKKAIIGRPPENILALL